MAEAKAPAKAPKVKIEREVQNGVTRPAEGTKTGTVWAICDKMYAAEHKKLTKKGKNTEAEINEMSVPVRGNVIEACVDKEINPATASTQYGAWCRFFDRKAIRVVKEKKETKKEDTK